MIYVTGDCHSDFNRFARKRRTKFEDADYVIVCGDFGLLWDKSRTFDYNLKWLSNLPFTILWVQGNHENYDMIKEYDIEYWNGGKVRHILRDKIILLERGQVFNIEGKTFFTFGGASSHDISGGILDRNAPDFKRKKKAVHKTKLSYRILGESWWKEELPSESEIEEARNNLEKVGYRVDYVISHCGCNAIQRRYLVLEKDILTDFFDELEEKLTYGHWYLGHYHINERIDEKHTVLYEEVIPIENL